MLRAAFPLLIGSTPVVGASSCRPGNDPIPDSTTGSAAAAADTSGAQVQLVKDHAGVPLDSIGNKPTTAGAGTGAPATSSPSST